MCPCHSRRASSSSSSSSGLSGRPRLNLRPPACMVGAQRDPPSKTKPPPKGDSTLHVERYSVSRVYPLNITPFTSSACKDTFCGHLTLTIWERTPQGKGDILVCAHSKSAALEVGGGPWWTAWSASAKMTEPLKSLVNLPIDVEGYLENIPELLQPPGL
ncbi:tocopherol cyclase [Cymbomonas tetramitiformis]|uniref:Tocopherol cyclase n=1 Tax=Cymbomonas tetramitiformis TaxID=36881 RepID=A0AAE0FG36_9CHLO|nr:tocopherol cyclase [Cymbomonas tetramitiformis]